MTDLTFFAGRDVVSLNDVQQLHNFFGERLPAYQKGFNQVQMRKQKYGFGVYIRKAFDQNKRHNSKAIIDFFSNPHRDQLENSVIDFLR